MNGLPADRNPEFDWPLRAHVGKSMGNSVIELPPPKDSCSPAAVQGRISGPYLLVVEQRLPLFRDPTGGLFAEELWQKDLAMHMEYINHLTIASPCMHQVPPVHAKPLPMGGATLEVIELPQQTGLLSCLRAMPTILARLRKAVRSAEVVHSGVVGWPVPMGWIVAPLCLIYRKPLVVVVESATWRLRPGIEARWKKRLRARLQESMARWVLRNAALVICTQEEYCRTLLGSKRAHASVIPASWIDENDILTDQQAASFWRGKLAGPESQLRILFVGRLVEDKGILILLDAIRKLSGEAVAISLDILGDGDLKPECERIASQLGGAAEVRLLGTVRYGEPLFKVIRTYDAVVVPSMTDEQPRIVFDAYSQAVPVLASDTPGLRSCIITGHSHLLSPPGDAKGLAALLRYCSSASSRTDAPRCRRLGLRQEHDPPGDASTTCHALDATA